MLRSSVIIAFTVGYVDESPFIWLSNSKSVAARGSYFVYSDHSFSCAFYCLLPESVARIGCTTRPPLNCAAACYRKDTRMRCPSFVFRCCHGGPHFARTCAIAVEYSLRFRTLVQNVFCCFYFEKKTSFKKINFRHIFCYKTP